MAGQGSAACAGQKKPPSDEACISRKTAASRTATKSIGSLRELLAACADAGETDIPARGARAAARRYRRKIRSAARTRAARNMGAGP